MAHFILQSWNLASFQWIAISDLPHRSHKVGQTMRKTDFVLLNTSASIFFCNRATYNWPHWLHSLPLIPSHASLAPRGPVWELTCSYTHYIQTLTYQLRFCCWSLQLSLTFAHILLKAFDCVAVKLDNIHLRTTEQFFQCKIWRRTGTMERWQGRLLQQEQNEKTSQSSSTSSRNA